MTEQALEQAREELRATLLDMLQKLDDAEQKPSVSILVRKNI